MQKHPDLQYIYLMAVAEWLKAHEIQCLIFLLVVYPTGKPVDVLKYFVIALAYWKTSIFLLYWKTSRYWWNILSFCHGLQTGKLLCHFYTTGKPVDICEILGAPNMPPCPWSWPRVMKILAQSSRSNILWLGFDKGKHFFCYVLILKRGSTWWWTVS